MASFMPRAKDVITEEDIQAWVSAGVRAAMPLMNSETREILLFAMQEHQRILEEQTRAMRRTLEVQSEAMQHTIETQGSGRTFLPGFGTSDGRLRKHIPAACPVREVAIWHMGKKRLAGNDPGALTFLGRFLLSATVTAGVVGLFRDVWSGPARARQATELPEPSRPLPTLPPRSPLESAQTAEEPSPVTRAPYMQELPEVRQRQPEPVAPGHKVLDEPQRPAEASTTLVHLSGMCVKAQDEVTGEDSTVLVFSDCADEPAKNLHFREAKGGTYLFQLGRQCAHPDDSLEASSEPRLSFPADCSSNRHILSFQKLAEDEQLPGFLIQFLGGAVQYCIHPYQGSESPSDGTELINHVQCDRGRKALRFRVGDPEQLAKEEPQLKKALGNPLIPVPQEEPCSYFGEGKSQSSRPGRPCIPPPPFWPYTGVTEWRTDLGRRILAAVTPTEEVSEAKCGGYFLLGDQTWCNRAFDGSHGYGQVGLSFGIEASRSPAVGGLLVAAVALAVEEADESQKPTGHHWANITVGYFVAMQ
ncbi:Ankrd54 [Symbiodinium sp. CCMP2592]|nr:Ankrd54 [Symbiodinium sp. CCMP2592]